MMFLMLEQGGDQWRLETVSAKKRVFAGTEHTFLIKCNIVWMAGFHGLNVFQFNLYAKQTHSLTVAFCKERHVISVKGCLYREIPCLAYTELSEHIYA